MAPRLLRGDRIGEHGITAYPEFHAGLGFTALASAGSHRHGSAVAGELAREVTR